MHHKNHKFSSSNHNNPQHMQDKIPSHPNPGGAYQPKKSNFLKSLASKFKEKPATKEEIEQLKLNTIREELKTRKQKAVRARPSRFSFLESSQPSGRRSNRKEDTNSFLFGDSKSNKEGGSWAFGSGPSFEMFGVSQEKRGKSQQRSGLEDLF